MVSFPGCKQQRYAQGGAFSASRPVDPGEGWGLCPGPTAGSPSCLPAAWLLRLTVRLPCCSLGTRGSGSRDWPVSRPRFRFLGERRGLAQLGWG